MTQNDPTKPPDPSAENDATPSTVWCKRCEAQVVPERKGQCPTCHSFLQQNFVARRHPINISLARNQHYQRLVADYQPQSVMLVAWRRRSESRPVRRSESRPL